MQLGGYIRIVNWTPQKRIEVGISKTEWISSGTEQYWWKYYFVGSLIVDMKSFIRLSARVNRKYGPF